MEDYKDIKPNSHKYKKEQEEEKHPIVDKKIEPIVKGKVVKKKNIGRKFTDVFVSEDVQNVKSYVIMDVLIPAVKKAVSDIVTNGIDMLLYGESGHTKKRSNASTVSYRNYYDDRREDRYSSRTKAGYSYADIVLESRIEAEEVVRRMDEILDTYGIVSVGDLYDLVGETGNYTDNKYGWTNLKNVDVVHVRDGWLIKMPKALHID